MRGSEIHGGNRVRRTRGAWKACVRLAVLMAAASQLLGCGDGDGRTAAVADPPNVIILMVDSLRLDAVSDYNETRNTSPRLSEFGRAGARFNRAYTNSSHTKISVASLFTGLLPQAHSVRKTEAPMLVEWGVLKTDKIPDELTTLAEVFDQAGYFTAGFTLNPHVRKFMGYAQGFDRFYWINYHDNRARDVNERVLESLEGDRKTSFLGRLYARLTGQADRPFFVYVHYMDVHNPYEPPLEYKGLYMGEGSEEIIHLSGLYGSTLEPEDYYNTRAVYDGQVKYWDDCFAEFLDRLEEKGYLDNTVVAVVSDHGEEFYEHKGFGHGYTVYEEQLRAPLYISWPGHLKPGQVIDERVEIKDLYPTLCEFAGIDVSDLDLQAESLFDRKASAPGKIVYAETFQGFAPRSVQNARFKLIYNTEYDSHELYDLETDPGEQHRLQYETSEDPEVKAAFAELKRKLSLIESMKPRAAAESVEIDEETKKQLKSLGYLE